MKKGLLFITVYMLFAALPVNSWYSQLFPFSAGTYNEATVSFNSRNWRLNDYSYVGYNLGETPLQTGIPCNVVTIAASGDITAALQAAVNTVGAAGGGIVKIPAGTFSLVCNPKPIAINYNNVSIEGAGSGYTILNIPSTHSFNEDANAFEGAFTFEKGNWAWNKGWSDPSTTLCTVTNTIAEGSTSITGLSNLAAVNEGDWVLIIQYYWATLVNTNGNGAWTICPPTCGGNPGREYAFSYLRKILSKDASGITIDAPIPYTLNPANNAINIKNPGVASGMVQNSGISGMSIQFADNNNSATQMRPSGCAVYFEGAVNCWVKDLFIYNFPRYGICIEYSARVTVADTYIKKSQDFGGGGNGYGFFNTCSQNVLIKNCVGEEARHNFIVSRAISSYVVMSHCRSIDSREGEDTHFSLAHAILRDDYYQSNGNDLNGYNRGLMSGDTYESYLSGALWNCAGDGYGGIYYGGTINITPSVDGSAIIIGGPDKHTVYDGSYYDNSDVYHAGDIVPLNPGLQVGPGPNGTRKNVLYEGLGSAGLMPQSLYEEQLKNRVGIIAPWQNVCNDAATFTPVPTNTPVLTPGILVYDSDHPAWGAGIGGGAPTPVNSLTPGNNIDDQGHNRTINGSEAIRYTATGSDWSIMTTFSGPSLLTTNMNKLDFWVYPTAANLNFRLQLQNFAAGVPTSLGSSLIVSGALADGGVFTINTWNHVAIPIASFGYAGTFNGIDIRVNTNTVGNTFWLDDIYFIPNSLPTNTNTPSYTATCTRTATYTATRTGTPQQTPTFTATAAGKWGACDKVLLAYYYNDGTMPYKADKIPYDKLTHICHAFVIPNADGSLNVAAGFLEPQLLLRAHAAGVKVLISIGGGGTYAACAAMAGNAATRNTFENNMTAFIQANGYDGIDIDWEAMANAADRTNYTSLITEFRAKFNASQPPGVSWLITAATPMTNWSGQWIDFPAIVNSVDFFNLMTYDMHGDWGDHAGHNAPLYANPSDPDGMSDVMGVDYMVVTRGVPASKVVMGVPFYGHNYLAIESLFGSCGGTCGAANVIYTNYKVVVTTYLNNGWTYNWDAVSHVPYLTKDSGPGVLVYDNPQSIAEKVNYAVATRNLKGVMMWDLSGDYIPWQGQPLMDSMFSAFMAACPSGFTATPTFTITPTYTVTPVWASSIIYDGDTAGAQLPDGVVTNSVNGGAITQVTGGNGGNAMQAAYVDSTWWSSHSWQLNTPKSTVGYNYLQFDIKATAGFIDALDLVLDWTKGQVNIMNYAPVGIPPYWITIQIPLSDLLMAGNTTIGTIVWAKAINYPYTVLIDNMKLVNIATPTNTPVTTATFTRTRTATASASATASVSPSNSYTRTPSATASVSPSATNTMTRSATASVSPSATNTMTRTASVSPSVTFTITQTRTASATPTRTYTVTLTSTPSASPTFTYTGTRTSTPAGSPTNTPVMTQTFTGTASRTLTLTLTLTFTSTRTPTFTRTATPTRTNSPDYSPTLTMTGTPPTSTITPTITMTETYTFTETLVPTETFTPTKTATPSVSSTESRVPSSTFTRTATPSVTLTLTLTLTVTPTPTRTRTPVITQTFTATVPAPTPTSTGVSEGPKLEINNVAIYPNPLVIGGALNIKLNLSQAPGKIKLKIYTVSFRAVREITWKNGIHAGDNTLQASSMNIGNLAGGVYYYVIKADNLSGTEAGSKAGPLVVLR